MGENEQGALLRSLVVMGIIGIVVGLFFTLAASQKKSTHDTITATTTTVSHPQEDKPADLGVNKMVDPDFTNFAKDRASKRGSEVWYSALPNNDALEVTKDGPGGRKALHFKYGHDTLNVPLIAIPSGAKKVTLKFDYRTEHDKPLDSDSVVVQPWRGTLISKTEVDQPIEDGYKERTLEYDLNFGGSIRWHLSSHDAFYVADLRVTFE